MALVFGLVVQRTSIGFAAVEYDPDARTGAVRRLGVRVFPEARDRWGEPKNATRREARLRRLQLRRRRERRRALQELLHDAGLLPERDSAEWQALMRKDPYELRRRAHDGAALAPHEVGRAIYHLAQRRHYKPSDLDGVAGDDRLDDDAERSALAAARDATAAAVRREDKTLGAWLAERGPRQRRRGVAATRGLVEEEFDRVWAPLVPPPVRDAVRDVIFHQRPVFWRRSALLRCALVPAGTPCWKGSWLAAQRRLFEDLNRLAVVEPAPRPLDDDERKAIRAALQVRSAVGWAGVRRALAPVYRARGRPGLENEVRFNLEAAGARQLLGNTVEAKLAGMFGRGWAKHPRRDAVRAAVADAIWDADYEEVGAQRVVIRSAAERRARRTAVAERFVAEFGLPGERAEKLKTLQLPTGWEPYSTEALEAMLPHLEAGARFDDIVGGAGWEAWRERAFPERERADGNAVDRLPSSADPEEDRRMRRLGNPTLVRTRNELRKVVNNLVAEWGRPDGIRVELARDLGRSNRRRREEAFRERRLARRRAACRELLEQEGIAEPTAEQVERWMLWEECGRVCPYSGRTIAFDALFRTGEFVVEYIWPRSRALRGGFRNKTLCASDVAAGKGARTPFELLGGDAGAWESIKTRVRSMEAPEGRGGMHPVKVRRFLAESLPEDPGRNPLNDVGYVARATRAYLAQLWPRPGAGERGRVDVIPGSVREWVRSMWSLQEVLGEGEGNAGGSHLRRAVDAVAVACCHRGISEVLARHWSAMEQGRPERLAPPWDGVAEDVREALAEVVVSHRASRKVSGPLHKETVLGDTELEETRRGATYRKFATRKPLEALSARELRDEIPERRVREIVQGWVEDRGGRPAKAVPPYPPRSARGPEIRKVRLHKEQQLGLMAKVGTGYAELANNHHVAIYLGPAGDVRHEVVSLLEASRRVARREPVVRRERDDGAEFLMSLAIGESLELVKDRERKIRVVKSVWGNGQVALVDHDDATGATRFTRNPATIVLNGGRKLAVDPIGRVRAAGD